MDSGDVKSYTHEPKRVHPIIYILITNKLATYHEIKYELTMDEVLDLYEIAMINLYNKSMIIENSKG